MVLERQGLYETQAGAIAVIASGIGIRGAVRGKVVKTTVPDTSVPCSDGKVNGQFKAPAPNLLWVSDFRYVSTWYCFFYIVFVIDTFADRSVGWRGSRSAKTDVVLPFRDIAVRCTAGQRMLWNRHFMPDDLIRKSC